MTFPPHLIVVTLIAIFFLSPQASFGTCTKVPSSQEDAEVSDPFEGYPQVKRLLAQLNDKSLSEDRRIELARDVIDEVKSADNDLLEFQTHIALLDNRLIQRNHDEYKNVLDSAAEIEHRVNAPGLVARLQYYRAKYLSISHRYKESIEWIKIAHASQLLSQQDLMSSNIVLAVSSARSGLFEQAFEAYQAVYASFELSESGEQNTKVRNAKSNVAWMLVKLKKYERAAALYDELEPLDPSQFIFLRVSLGRCEIALINNEIDTAMKLSQRAIEISEHQERRVNAFGKNRHRGLKGLSYLVQARCFYELEDYSKAQALCEKAIELIGLTRPHRLFEAKAILGVIVAKRGTPELGIEMVREAYQSADESGQVYSKLIASEKLAKLYEDNGRYGEAFAQLKLTEQIEDYLKVEDLELRLEFTELRHQAKLDEQRIKLVKTEERAKTEQAKLVAISANSQADKSTAIQFGFGAAFVLTVLGGTGYFVSQTRRRKIQDQLNEARKRAEQQEQLAQKKRIEDIGELTGSVAHEFNNILQVICQTNFLIEDALGEHLTSRQRMLLQTEDKAIAVASKITEQLLTYAKRQATDPKVTRVAGMLESTQELFDSVSDSVQVNLLKFDETLAINVDQSHFSSSILNLLLNARDSMEGAGLIEISVTDKTISKTNSLQLRGGDYVCIEVCDTGKGMTEEQLRRACEPFFTTKPPKTGTGLGLSSVKGFVEQAGGAINIASTIGSGALVSLYFPKADFTEIPILPATSGFGEAMRNEKVCLIVEDNPLVRSTLELLMESRGYDCTSCCSADDAHSLLKSNHKFSLVLSDISMPGEWDGIDLAQWIKQMYPEVQVVLISGNEAPPDLDDFIFLRKPFRISDLRSILEIENVHQ